MPNRREFIRNVGGATAAAIVGGSGVLAAAAGALQTTAARRRQVIVGGRRVKTIDVHTHGFVRAVLPLLRNVDWADIIKSSASGARGNRITPDFLGPERVRFMDENGIDVQAISINPYWNTADRAMATRLIAVQNEALAADCARYPGRFVGMASVALQHPDLAARQVEEAVKKFGMPGVALGCNIAGEELSSPRFDPFWAKVQELHALVFIHPQVEGGGFDGLSYPAEMFSTRLKGSGDLRNVIHHPLETTVAFSHLIFDGTLDKFPELRICGAHGGGYLPSYVGRSDATCLRPNANCTMKKKPSEYFKEQLLCDSLVFNSAELRLRVKEYGAGQVVLGTDHPAPWPVRGVDHILETPGLTDDEKIAVLGGNLAKLLNIPPFEAAS
jgi:aminocarboxymuconate-semialdehyde decarboxylase